MLKACSTEINYWGRPVVATVAVPTHNQKTKWIGLRNFIRAVNTVQLGFKKPTHISLWETKKDFALTKQKPKIFV